MSLPDDTLQVMAEVERVSGKPVHLVTDTSMRLLAKVSMARQGLPAHLVTYNPNARGAAYNIAYQCGYVIRAHQAPPGSRCDFVVAESGRADVRRMMSGPGGSLARTGLPVAALNQAADQMYDGLLTQLRSYAPGMRIDMWLRDTHAGLRNDQRQSITKQQADNAQVLGPEIRKMAPPTVFSANVAMNAAYALFCDRLLESSIFSVPYRSIGALDRGARLLDLFDRMEPDASADRDLIDAWGSELGLSDWYKWVPSVG